MNYEKLQKPNICKISHINTEKRHVTLCHTIFREITSIYNNGLVRNVTWMMRNCKKKENSFSPRRRFLFQTEISSNYIVLVLISRVFLFPFLSSPWGSVCRFLYSIYPIYDQESSECGLPSIVYRLPSTVCVLAHAVLNRSSPVNRGRYPRLK